MKKTTVTLQNFKSLGDDLLLTLTENPGNLIVAGINGFFGLLFHLIQLIAAAAATHRTRTATIEANQIKIEAAITALQKEMGADEAELLMLEHPGAEVKTDATAEPVVKTDATAEPVVKTEISADDHKEEGTAEPVPASKPETEPTPDQIKAKIDEHTSAIATLATKLAGDTDISAAISDHQTATANLVTAATAPAKSAS